MTGGVILTSARMRRAPVAGKNPFTTAALVDDGIDCEYGSDHRRDVVGFLVHGIACQSPGGGPCAAPAAFEIQRQHVRGFNRLASGQTRTDRLPPPGNARELMKANRAGENYFVE